MEDVGAMRSAVDIRERVNALVPAMMTSVELIADRVRADATDADIRRRALRFKIDLVPAIYEAGFRADPLAAGLDLWLMSYQVADCLEAGVGLCDFGAQQPAARTAARHHREALDRLFEEASLNRSALEWERQLVRDTADRYPLQNLSSLRQRRSITSELAKAMNVEPLNPLDLLGSVATTLTSLSSRLNLYVEEAARLAQWHGELLAEDMVGWPSVDRAFGDIGRATASVEQLSKTLDPEFLNALVERPIDAVREERKAAMAEIDHQRSLTLQYLSAERQALVETAVASLTAALNTERVNALAELRKERLETLAEIERLRRDLITEGFAEGRRFVDHAAWRLAQLMGGTLILVTILAWAMRRRRPREA